MISRAIGAAAVIVDDGGRVLLVKHAYGRRNWELPGGNVEANEPADETAGREVREETGLRVRVERLVGIYYERGTDMRHFAFVCRQQDESASPRPDQVEIGECGFRPPDNLPRPISDFTVRRVHDAVAATATASLVTITHRQWFA